MKNWFSIKNLQDNTLNISIHDEIGLWGITAADFMKELNGHAGVKSINLSIHSPGGSVLDGLAIYNTLASHPAKIFGKVEGIAASAASFILMASDVISMPSDSFIMIHNAHGGAIGDAKDLRDTADVIEKLQNSIVNIYEKRTGNNRQDIINMMQAVTWMSASEAVDNGFADTITDAVDVAAKINVFNKYFKEMPVGSSADVESIDNSKDFERFLRDAGGVSRGLAKALTSQAKIVFQRDVGAESSQDLAKVEAALKQLDRSIN